MTECPHGCAVRVETVASYRAESTGRWIVLVDVRHRDESELIPGRGADEAAALADVAEQARYWLASRKTHTAPVTPIR